MTKLPFDNSSSPAERRRVMREAGGTYHDIAQGEAGTTGGRYAAQAKTHVTGSNATIGSHPPVQYPSHWASDVLGQEPPLGFSIEAQEPVGTPAEIEYSLREAGAGGDSPSVPEPTLPGDGAPQLDPRHPPAASAAPSPLSKRSRRRR